MGLALDGNACDRASIEVTLPKPMTSGIEAKVRFGKQDFVDMGEWAKATSAYARARKDLLELFAEGLDNANPNNLISVAGPLYAEATFAAAKQGDNQAALELAAEGRARLMSVL